MAKNFKNSPKGRSFLDNLPQDSVIDSDIDKRCKFNFSYLTIQGRSQRFEDWNESKGDSKLVKLMEKLKEFTKQPLLHWQKEKIGKGKRGGQGKRQHCLEIYPDFPANSAFTHPPHVPHDVSWGRFRIDYDTRLAGFVIPQSVAENCQRKGLQVDTNTFYVVFLDENHDFYQ